MQSCRKALLLQINRSKPGVFTDVLGLLRFCGRLQLTG